MLTVISVDYGHLRQLIYKHLPSPRTGYVITYCGCPIHWVSKLQSEIALSTTEAEYIMLSMCMHDLIPMRNLLSEILKGFKLKDLTTPLINNAPIHAFTKMHQLVVFKDNMGCLEIASKPEQFHPQTKHIISNGITSVIKFWLVMS